MIDITYCSNTKCRVERCRRNQNNIRIHETKNISIADLEGTEDCPDFGKERENDENSD